MTVVDTSALMAILRREPEAQHFTSLLTAGASAMSAASYLETIMVAVGRGIAGRTEAEQLVDDFGIDVVPVTRHRARLAADAFIRFGKGRHPAGLNYGDCFAYALAKERGEPLLFKGDGFARTDVASAA